MAKQKKWNIGSREDDGSIARIAEALGISFPTACLLHRRGYKTPEEASAFIRLEAELLHDPFLMADMKKAAERLADAIEKKEKTVIYGDYDVDGVTAVCLLCLYLKKKGADVSYYIPNRVGEGYGVNCEAIKKLSDEGNSLFVTVDTGITAISEAEYCRSLGCDMIITDHHECREELPSALAVVNPRRSDCPYPFKELAGVGVAFKLVTAVEYLLRLRKNIDTDGFLTDICREYIDLAALGTVADVMPLRDENRLIVSMGLSIMERSPRPAISALLSAADSGRSSKKKKMTSSVVGFTIAPRINAAGRMSSASRAAELFLSENTDCVESIAQELCEINVQRQEEENKIVDELKGRIEECIKNGSPVIVLEDDGWNHGVIGIVASRITEKYGRPSIIISFDDDMGKGSGRSVKGMNLVEALCHCSEHLVKYGGHELAAGLTIKREDLDAFKQKLNEYAVMCLGGNEPEAVLDLDCELSPFEITLRQAEELELLEPCGVSNPTPSFYCPKLTVSETIPMGQGRHTKLILEGEDRKLTAVHFGCSPSELGFSPSDVVDIAFRLGINEFRGVRSEQILIRDMRLNASLEKKQISEYEEYDKIISGNKEFSDCQMPVRQDFVSIYLHLKRSLPEGGGDVNLRSLMHEISQTRDESSPMGYIKLRLSLDILSEGGVITLTDKRGRDGGESFTVTIPHIDTKVDLEKSCIYKQLMKQKKTISQV